MPTNNPKEGYHPFIGEYSILRSMEYDAPSYEISRSGITFHIPENSSANAETAYINRVSPLVRELLQKEGYKGVPSLSGLIQDYVHFDEVLGKVLIHRNPRCKRLVASFPEGNSVRVSIPMNLSLSSAVKSLEMNRAYLLEAMTKGGLKPDFNGEFFYGRKADSSRNVENAPTKTVRKGKVSLSEKDGKRFYTDEVLGEISVVVNPGNKRINLRISRDGEIILSVPSMSSLSDGVEFLKTKRKWIEKAKARVTTKKVLLTPEMLSDRGELDRLYSECATRLIARTGELSSLLGVNPASVDVGFYTAKWGKCSSGGKITLNFATGLLPRYLQDAIIIHEITHLKFMDHGDGFHNQMESYLRKYVNHEFAVLGAEFPEGKAPSADADPSVKADWKNYLDLFALTKKANASRAMRPTSKVINDDLKKYSIK